MKHLRIITVLLSLLLLFTASSFARRGYYGQRRYYYNRYYDAKKEISINGKIVRVQLISGLNNGRYKMVQLSIKSTQKNYTVHLGPEWYINKNIKLKKGDKIFVTGSYVKINSDKILIVRELKKDKKIYKLRDRSGLPLWARFSRSRNQ